MSDARRTDDLGNRVLSTAFDLREQIVRLARAIAQAREGSRGWNIARWWIVQELNVRLKPLGLRVVDEDPNKSFEWYPKLAEETRRSWRHERFVRQVADALGMKYGPGELPSDEAIAHAVKLLKAMYEASQEPPRC